MERFMKKFLIVLAIMLLAPLYAYSANNIIPEYVSIQNTSTFGLYQAPNEIVLYKEPSESSNIVNSISWIGSQIFPESVNFKDLFVVYMPDKNLAFLAVSDETEDWVEVIYNNSTGDKGWLKKDDPYRFMTWVMFYNTYGRKYGLKLLKESPAEAKDIHSSTEDNSQIVGTINMPQKINLTAIRGNYALVSVFDMDKTPKTGYVRWKSDKGVKYYFPDIK
jgi:hypothetical protein